MKSNENLLMGEVLETYRFILQQKLTSYPMLFPLLRALGRREVESVLHDLDRMFPQLLPLVLVPNISRFRKILTIGASSPRTWFSRSVVYGVPHVLSAFRPRYGEGASEREKYGARGTNQPGRRGGNERGPHKSRISVDEFQVRRLF